MLKRFPKKKVETRYFLKIYRNVIEVRRSLMLRISRKDLLICSGTTRDRTALFIQYRNSFGKQNNITAKYQQRSDDTERLLLGQKPSLLADDSIAIEMTSLPPRWFLSCCFGFNNFGKVGYCLRCG